MCKPKKVYHPPELPRDFKPVHKPAEQTVGFGGVAAPSGLSTLGQKPKRLDANERSTVLGETPHFSEDLTK